MAVRLVGGRATSLQFAFMTDLEWAAAFSFPNIDWVCGENRNYRFMSCLHIKEEDNTTKQDTAISLFSKMGFSTNAVGSVHARRFYYFYNVLNRRWFDGVYEEQKEAWSAEQCRAIPAKI